MSDTLQQATQQAQQTASEGKQTVSEGKQTVSEGKETASEGTQSWDAMSEEQKKQTFDALPADQKKGKTYMEWIREGYQHQKENWMPWIEDMYLKWFTKDNKASYVAKDTLDKSKVTGVDQIDNLQDGMHNMVAGQLGQGGMLQPLGDMASKEGINRMEREGKDDEGTYSGGATKIKDSVVSNIQAGGEAVSGGAQSAGASVWNGAQNAGGYVGGMLTGGTKKDQQ